MRQAHGQLRHSPPELALVVGRGFPGRLEYLVRMEGHAGIKQSLGLTECIGGRQAHILTGGGYPWHAIGERASETVARSRVAGPSTRIPVTVSAGNSFMRHTGGRGLVHTVILPRGRRHRAD